LRVAGLRVFRRAWRRVLTGAGAAAVLIAVPGVGHVDPATPAASAANTSADARKQPMRFSWHARGEGTPGLVFAVGSVTGDTPAAFERLASAHDLRGATMVLNSVGGSVLDTLTLGRRWRELGLATTVGSVARTVGAGGAAVGIRPDAACESMCAFLLLAGTNRDVPPGARVRVHQIWLGDRVGDARESSYSAQDMTIVQRDVGRLAQYTFEMGGSGALLSIALSVPPWEPLHELSPDELIAARLVTRDGGAIATNRAAPKLQDRFAVSGGGRAPAAGPARLGEAAPAAAQAAATGGVAHGQPAAAQ